MMDRITDVSADGGALTAAHVGGFLDVKLSRVVLAQDGGVFDADETLLLGSLEHVEGGVGALLVLKAGDH